MMNTRVSFCGPVNPHRAVMTHYPTHIDIETHPPVEVSAVKWTEPSADEPWKLDIFCGRSEGNL